MPRSKAEKKEPAKIEKIVYILWSIIGGFILVALLLYFLFLIRNILTPFFLAIALVYILRPAVDYFEKHGLKRVFSIIIVYVFFLLVSTLFLVVIIPVVFDQFDQLASQFPQYIDTVKELISYWQLKIFNLKIDPIFIRSLEQVFANSQGYIVSLFSTIPRAGINFIYFIFNLILAPILAFYILKDLKVIRETVFGLVPERMRKEAEEIIQRIDLVLGGFIKGQLIIAFLVGTMAWLALLLLGVDYALVIGLVTGALNVIPYFGPIIGGALAALVALFESYTMALWVILIMVVIQQIDALLLNPYIMSKQVKLHPVLIVFSLFLGAYIMGIIGMLLAIPIAAVGKVLVYFFVEEKRREKNR